MCNRTRYYITKLISFVVKNPNERHKRMTNWPDLYSNSNQNCLSYLTRVKNRVLLNELITFSKNQEQNTTKEYIKSQVDVHIPNILQFCRIHIKQNSIVNTLLLLMSLTYVCNKIVRSNKLELSSLYQDRHHVVVLKPKLLTNASIIPIYLRQKKQCC